MNHNDFEQLYVTGNFRKLIETITNLAYSQPSTNLTSKERAICLFYHSRSLIRLGNVNGAEDLITERYNSEEFSISNLINLNTIINLLITQGKVDEAIRDGMDVIAILEEREHELVEKPEDQFWFPFPYYFIGIAFFYKFKNDLAWNFFQKSLGVNQTNLFIRAKCLYYMAFLELEKGGTSKFFNLLEESLVIYRKLDAKQGIAWNKAWLGQFYLQRGDFESANTNFSQASELFRTINDLQGSSLVNSLIGLMYYQQGNIKQAKEMLELAFETSIEIGNPMILSYCVIPLILLYVDLGDHLTAQKCINQLEEACKNADSERVKVHSLIAKAIYLKASSRFSEKAQAQNILLTLLNEEGEKQSHGSHVWLTSDKSFSFLVITHLAELYLEEFKISEDPKIMLEVQQLIDNQIQRIDEQKFSPELVELSLLKAKLLLIEGEIEEAIKILENAKIIARANNFHRIEEKVNWEITRVDEEFKKWDAAVTVKDRIKEVQLEEYLKKVQKMVSLHQSLKKEISDDSNIQNCKNANSRIL